MEADRERAAAVRRSSVRLRERAEAGRLSATRHRDQVLADCHQALLDAEVRATRRRLVRGLFPYAGSQATDLLDEDFLAVADRLTVCRAIVDVAVSACDATATDLQLYGGPTADCGSRPTKASTRTSSGSSPPCTRTSPPRAPPR